MHLKIALLVTVGAIMILVSSLMLLVHLRDANRRVAETEQAIASFGGIVALPALTRAVARGEEIGPADRTSVQMPASYIPDGFLRRWPAPRDAAERVYALENLAPNQLLSENAIWMGASGDGPLFSAGRSAIPLAPRNLDEILPELKIGDRLDVYWRRDVGGGGSETRRIAASLRLLSLPTERPPMTAAPGKRAARTLLLEAGEDSVPILTHAASQGEFYVARSGSATTAENGEIVVDDRALRGLPLARRAAAPAPAAPATAPETAPQAEAPRLCSLAVVRSAQRSVLQVPCH